MAGTIRAGVTATGSTRRWLPRASESLQRLLNDVSSVRAIGYYIASLGFVLSLIFCFLVYPRIAEACGAALDPDRQGLLGFGYWKYGTLSYFPSHEITLDRGPIYPLYIALLLKVSHGWWPYSVQAGQCLLSGLTCLMVFWIARTLWGLRSGVLASTFTAVHPFLLWYTSRIWIETLETCLFTTIVAATLYLLLKPSWLRAGILGLVLGVAALARGVFLPFVAIVPLSLGCLKQGKLGWGSRYGALLAGLLTVLPWSLRNWDLTHHFIPIHLGYGQEFQRGDFMVDTYTKSPFSLIRLWDEGTRTIVAPLQSLTATASLPQREAMPGWQIEVTLNSVLYRRSLHRYKEHPLFLARKIIVNAWTFWTLGETELKSAVIAALQIPLLLMFVLGCIGIVKRGETKTRVGLLTVPVILYFSVHLPIVARARYSVVLVPIMLVYAVGPAISMLNGGSCFASPYERPRGECEEALRSD